MPIIIRRRVNIVRPPRYPMPSYPLAGNAIDEQRGAGGGMGELPEDLMSERLMRDPIFSPRVAYLPGKGAVIVPPNNAGTGGTISPRYKSSVIPFVAQLASTKVINGNPLRAYLLVQNNSGSSIFVNFGADASATNGIQVVAAGNLIFEGGNDGGSFVPQEDVYILGAAAGLACVVMEGLTYHT